LKARSRDSAPQQGDTTESPRDRPFPGYLHARSSIRDRTVLYKLDYYEQKQQMSIKTSKELKTARFRLPQGWPRSALSR
jgi:hypothetical protein